MANQNSIIVYTPQPYYTADVASVTDYIQIDTVENRLGVLDPKLSNYTTVVPNSGVSEFGIRINFSNFTAPYEAIDMSAALVGCSMLTYEDSGGSPDFDTVFNEDIICAMGSQIGTNGDQLITYAHSSQNEIHTFGREPLPGIISGGQTNLIFHGLGAANDKEVIVNSILFVRSADDVTARPHVRLILGHFLVGIDMPIIIDPKSFTWRLGLKTKRFSSRDEGNISSEGTLVRRVSGEIIRIGNNTIVGSEVTDTTTDIVANLVPNFFNLTKVNNSYPLLISPYPVGAIGASGITVEEANLTARQNFFSVYGFLEDSFEIQTGEFRDGLNSEYKARFRITETR